MTSSVKLKAMYPRTKYEMFQSRLKKLADAWLNSPPPKMSRVDKWRARHRRWGPMYRYRNRQVMRKMDFDSPMWAHQVRRHLTR